MSYRRYSRGGKKRAAGLGFGRRRLFDEDRHRPLRGEDARFVFRLAGGGGDALGGDRYHQKGHARFGRVIDRSFGLLAFSHAATPTISETLPGYPRLVRAASTVRSARRTP